MNIAASNLRLSKTTQYAMGRGLQSGGGREGSRRTLCLLSAIKNQEDEEGGRSKDIYDDDELTLFGVLFAPLFHFSGGGRCRVCRPI